MTALRSTYRRADGQLVQDIYDVAPSNSVWTNFLNEQIPADYIEEQWDGDTLVRYRTIRLGADEKCDQTNEISASDYRLHNKYCVCSGTGVKPRVSNPEWTEVKSETVAIGVPTVCPRCFDEKEVFDIDAEDGYADCPACTTESSPAPIDWKAICDRFYEQFTGISYSATWETLSFDRKMGIKKVFDAYESALAQEQSTEQEKTK